MTSNPLPECEMRKTSDLADEMLTEAKNPGLSQLLSGLKMRQNLYSVHEGIHLKNWIS